MIGEVTHIIVYTLNSPIGTNLQINLPFENHSVLCTASAPSDRQLKSRLVDGFAVDDATALCYDGCGCELRCFAGSHLDLSSDFKCVRSCTLCVSSSNYPLAHPRVYLLYIRSTNVKYIRRDPRILNWTSLKSASSNVWGSLLIISLTWLIVSWWKYTTSVMLSWVSSSPISINACYVLRIK